MRSRSSATRTARRQRSARTTSRPGAPHLQAGEPVWLELANGDALLELPTTHSLGMLARGVLAPLRRQIVHAYFHDTDLLDRHSAAALRAA